MCNIVSLSNIQLFFFFLDEAENTSPWTEHVDSQDLQNVLASFCLNIPEDPINLSFAKHILKRGKLTELVKDVKDLATGVVLYKYLSGADEKPGTVNVYEVIAKNIDNQIVIKETVIYLILGNVFLKWN